MMHFSHEFLFTLGELSSRNVSIYNLMKCLVNRSFLLSRNKKLNWKLSGWRSQGNENLAHNFWVICRNVSRTFVEFCMEAPFWCTNMAAGNQQEHLEFTFSVKALSFHSRTRIRAHKHILYGCTAENQKERLIFGETEFLFWCHALWKLGSSNCFIFEMKHATGMEACSKIYFLFIFNLV